MSNEKKTEMVSSDIEWNAENEVQLFYAMRGHKPIGISKNFHMIAILEAFVNSSARDISSKEIWNHLNELYDMETLHENEEIEFPNNDIDFTIEGNPEFDELIANKITNESIKTDKDNDNKGENEVTSGVTKTGPKSSANSKTQDLNKTNTKGKTSEIEKNVKSEKKEEIVKHDKSDEIEDKSNRTKKQQSKSSIETTRSASHNTPSSAKKRKN